MSHDHDAACACTSDHRPPVLEYNRHHIWPEFMGGPDTEDNIVWLCPTAHVNVHELLRMMVAALLPFSQAQFQHLLDRPVNRYAVIVARDGYFRWRGSA